MRRIVFILELVLVSLLSANAQIDTNIVVLDMLSNERETNMIDSYGKLIMTFSADERCKIEDDINIKFLSFSLERSFDFFDFSQGYLPVVKNKNWKFYNIKGEKVKDFEDQYYSFTCPVDGVYRAYEKVKDSNNDFRVVYINQNFEEMFSGQRFWEATNLKGGYAFVQLKDKNGPWAILDAETESLNPIDSLVNKNIRKIDKDSKGYGIISYKDFSRKDYIDKNGIFNSPKKDKIELTTEQKKQVENLQICINNHSYPLSTGIGIENPEFMPKLKSENKELEWGVVFNHKYIPNWMKLKQEEFFFCEVASDKYFGGLVLDTLEKKNFYRYYDFLEKKNTFTTDKRIEYIYGNKFFVTTPSPSGYSTNLIEILDHKGNVIYSLSPQKRLFVGIESTLELNTADIYKLHLSEDEDLSLLKNYDNVRHIAFNKFTFTHLPNELSNFTNLGSLKISKCNNLTELPLWLENAINLKKIEIKDCKNLRNLENLIENATSLEFIKTQNYRFEDGFIKRMKESKPNLIIDNIYQRNVKLE